VTPRFNVGDHVRIDDRHEDRHNRTPLYVRGKAGVVERVCGAFGEPELLAYGRYGDPPQTLYRVHLAQTDIWPDYAEAPGDSLEIEIFEHWLEPA
jgi:nitrile hydratase